MAEKVISLFVLRDLKYIGLCRICKGALWIDSYFRVYKNGKCKVCESAVLEEKWKTN